MTTCTCNSFTSSTTTALTVSQTGGSVDAAKFTQTQNAYAVEIVQTGAADGLKVANNAANHSAIWADSTGSNGAGITGSFNGTGSGAGLQGTNNVTSGTQYGLKGIATASVTGTGVYGSGGSQGMGVYGTGAGGVQGVVT